MTKLKYDPTEIDPTSNPLNDYFDKSISSSPLVKLKSIYEHKNSQYYQTFPLTTSFIANQSNHCE